MLTLARTVSETLSRWSNTSPSSPTTRIPSCWWKVPGQAVGLKKPGTDYIPSTKGECFSWNRMTGFLFPSIMRSWWTWTMRQVSLGLSWSPKNKERRRVISRNFKGFIKESNETIFRRKTIYLQNWKNCRTGRTVHRTRGALLAPFMLQSFGAADKQMTPAHSCFSVLIKIHGRVSALVNHFSLLQRWPTKAHALPEILLFLKVLLDSCLLLQMDEDGYPSWFVFSTYGTVTKDNMLSVRS